MSPNDEKRLASTRQGIESGSVSVEDLKWLLVVIDFYREWAEYAIDIIELKGHEDSSEFYDKFYRNISCPRYVQ